MTNKRITDKKQRNIFLSTNDDLDYFAKYGKDVVGELNLRDKTGGGIFTCTLIRVEKNYQHAGIATELFNFAQENFYNTNGVYFTIENWQLANGAGMSDDGQKLFYYFLDKGLLKGEQISLMLRFGSGYETEDDIHGFH